MNILHLFSISIIVSGSLYPVFALDTPQVCDASSQPHYHGIPSSHIYITDTNGSLPYNPLTYHTAIMHDDDVWNTSTQPRIVQVTLTIQNQDTGQQVFNQTQSLQMKACSGPEKVQWNFVPTQIAYYMATITDDKSKTSMDFYSIHNSTVDSQIILSPLQQFKSGTNTGFIICKPGSYFVLKSYDREPLCLKAGTISKLASRGFLFATSTSNDNHTTVIISPGSENQASPNTYSPNITTVVLGINNTVRWVNQADVGNTIVPDMPLIQNGKSFGSDGIIKPDQSYTFTFTEPGTFTYHTEPHPWMKGTVIVLQRSHQITSTKTNDPFGMIALVIYHPPDLCLNPSSHSIPFGLPSCPPNKFYLKINSNSTAYLMGYRICDGNSCATNNNLSLILPLNTDLSPDYQMIGLPVNLPWKYGDTVGIQLYVSPTDDNKTASLVDLGNSAIVS